MPEQSESIIQHLYEYLYVCVSCGKGAWIGGIIKNYLCKKCFKKDKQDND